MTFLLLSPASPSAGSPDEAASDTEGGREEEREGEGGREKEGGRERGEGGRERQGESQSWGEIVKHSCTSCSLKGSRLTSNTRYCRGCLAARFRKRPSSSSVDEGRQ